MTQLDTILIEEDIDEFIRLEIVLHQPTDLDRARLHSLLTKYIEMI